VIFKFLIWGKGLGSGFGVAGGGARFGTERRVKALKFTAAFVSPGPDLVDYERRIIRSPEVDPLLRWRMVAAARNYCGPDPEEIDT
jgi:hypothetical protein